MAMRVRKCIWLFEPILDLIYGYESKEMYIWLFEPILAYFDLLNVISLTNESRNWSWTC